MYLSMVPSSSWIASDSGASSVLMKSTSSVARQRFRDRREAAHVHEHHGEFAGSRRRAASPSGELLQLRQQFRREILPERLAHEFLLAVGGHVQHALDRDVGRQRRQRRIDRIDQQPEMRERDTTMPPTAPTNTTPPAISENREPNISTSAATSEPEQQRQHDLEAVGPVRPLDEILRDDLLDQLRLDRDARHHLAERRGAGVEQARGRGADQHDRALDPLAHLGVLGRIEHVLDRDVALRPVAVEIHPGLAVMGQRQLELADPHVEQRGVAGVGVAAGAGAAHHDALLVLRHPQRLDRQAGIDPRAVRQQHRHPPHHAGAVARAAD